MNASRTTHEFATDVSPTKVTFIKKDFRVLLLNLNHILNSTMFVTSKKAVSVPITLTLLAVTLCYLTH